MEKAAIEIRSPPAGRISVLTAHGWDHVQERSDAAKELAFVASSLSESAEEAIRKAAKAEAKWAEKVRSATGLHGAYVSRLSAVLSTSHAS